MDSHCPIHHNQAELDSYPLPPGRFGPPIIGETIDFARDPLKFVQERQKLYGDVFRSHILGNKTVFLLDEGANRWIFGGEERYLQNRWNSSTRKLLGEQCVAMLTGEAHKKRRQQLQPSFKHGAMRAFAPTMQAIAERYFEAWASHDEPITVLERMKPLVFELITTFTLGEDAAHLNTPRISRLFRTWMAGITTLPIRFPFSPYSRALKAKTALLQAFKPIIEQRRQQSDGAQQDILTALLQADDVDGQPLSDEAIAHDLQDQIFAGYDTTVTVMTSLMLQVAQHPAVLATARAEIKAAGLGQPLDLDRLRKLPYLNQLINESMRHMAPVTGSFRVMLRDEIYNGYRIPQGWTVRVEIAGTHRDERRWTQADQFDPDRWGAERAEQRQQNLGFIPFGGGPRICLGQSFALTEMRVMLALLLRDYRWELLPEQDLSYQMIPFARPKSGLKVYFRRY